MRRAASLHRAQPASSGDAPQCRDDARGAERTLERLLTSQELAGLLRLNVKTVERMARAGRLPSVRVCGRTRFRPSDIASWLAAREDRTCLDC